MLLDSPSGSGSAGAAEPQRVKDEPLPADNNAVAQPRLKRDADDQAPVRQERHKRGRPAGGEGSGQVPAAAQAAAQAGGAPDTSGEQQASGSRQAAPSGSQQPLAAVTLDGSRHEESEEEEEEDGGAAAGHERHWGAAAYDAASGWVALVRAAPCPASLRDCCMSAPTCSPRAPGAPEACSRRATPCCR